MKDTLNLIIPQKESRIEELQQHIIELQEKQNTQMVSSLNNSLENLQSATERKLQHVLDMSLEQMEHSRGQAATARRQVEESSKQHQQIKRDNQTQLQDIEKRYLVTICLKVSVIEYMFFLSEPGNFE